VTWKPSLPKPQWRGPPDHGTMRSGLVAREQDKVVFGGTAASERLRQLRAGRLCDLVRGSVDSAPSLRVLLLAAAGRHQDRLWPDPETSELITVTGVQRPQFACFEDFSRWPTEDHARITLKGHESYGREVGRLASTSRPWVLKSLGLEISGTFADDALAVGSQLHLLSLRFACTPSDR
jgi:hypothetical protein